MSHSSSYDPQTSEPHWQSEWEAQKLFQHSEMQLQTEAQIKDKEYLLFAFAYPSGSGLHVGHVESKTALDILARYKRMNGKHVFFPVGWDAFGLPAENYAIKTGIHPAKTTLNAIHTFRRQIKRIGISYDWANEVATNHPGYYRWTQWIFLQLYKKGLAYQGTGMVNWCPSCQTVLANEQVVNGKCERCGTQVIQKQLKQWYFKITKYQDELLSGLEDVDWPEPTKQQQKHWIGKNKGLNIDFTIRNSSQKLQIWTKFWETIFGVTFLVIAPEKFNEFELINQVPQEKRAEVEAYLDASFKKTEEERKIGEKDKTGVDTGIKVINPVNGTESPLYIADYVLTNVGTGVVMGVPAHDERDFAFAKKYGLPCLQVVEYQDEALNNKVREGEASFEGEGTLVNSGEFNGQPAWGEGKKNMAEWMIEQGFGRWQTTYKLRDWLISRQRYWGAPIPIVYDPQGKPHPIKEEHLPWLLPDDVDFKPTGESPLKSSKEFFERTERLYGKGWTPECDTMDTFVDSSWYFLRYLSARNEQTFLDLEQAKKWLPVDLYLIGPEHIVLHLLYSRFFTKFLRDEGYLSFGEPFLKMRHQGMILGPDGKKMSKSKGNVINPDDIIEKYGADTLRMYEMFMGPLESDKPWDTGSVIGIYRLLQRIHALVSASTATSGKAKSSEVFTRALHQTLKKVGEDIEDLKFNTAIAAIMILVNTWEGLPEEECLSINAKDLQDFVAMLAPFAPFMSEALYQELLVSEGKERASIHLASWPKVNSAFLEQNEITVVVQVNGKLRGEMKASPDEAKKEDLMVSRGEKVESVQRWVKGKKHLKTVFVPGKLVNFVVAE